MNAEVIARFFLTHSEFFTWEGEPLDKPNAKGKYTCHIEPSSFKASDKWHKDNLEYKVQLWAQALRKAGLAQ